MFLERIVAQTKNDLEQRKREIPLVEVQRLAAAQPAPLDLYAALSSGSTIKLIAEVKRASPSKGLLAPHLDPVEIARTYEANGAAAISVLTEPHFFLGSPDYLKAIKQVVQVPLLRKDFIIDEYQVYEARAWGADAILLICAILDDNQLRYLLGAAHNLGMYCLVEVHTTGETQRAVAAGAKIIGVNSRDLVTFQMNPHLMRELPPLIPADRVVVAESGIHTAADARRLARYDVSAMLVGESLIVSNDIPFSTSQVTAISSRKRHAPLLRSSIKRKPISWEFSLTAKLTSSTISLSKSGYTLSSCTVMSHLSSASRSNGL